MSGTPDTNLTSRTVHALKWSYLSTFTNAALQIIVTMTLARLLTPSAFGLVAMAVVVLRFGQYFAQVGVGPALVQRPEVSDDDVRAAFTSSVILGLVFFAANWLLAPVFSSLFHNESLVPVLRAMGLLFVGDGLVVVPLAMLRRHLRFRAIAFIETGTYAVAYAGVGIVLALLGFGVWALVTASVIPLFVCCLLFMGFARPPMKPNLRWRHLSRLYGFGARVSVITFVEFLCFNLDTMWAGRYLGATSVGIYSRAFNLVNLPKDYIGSSLTRVMMPSFAQVQFEDERLAPAYVESLRVLLFVTIPPLWGMAVASREVVSVLLGSQWLAAVPIVTIFAIVAPLSLGAHLTGVLLEATARLSPDRRADGPGAPGPSRTSRPALESRHRGRRHGLLHR